MEKPVFIINGFLEGGKTTFIKTTFEDPEFTNGDKILILQCEEGEEEYDLEAFAKKNVSVENIDEMDALTEEYMLKLNKEYKPDKIVIELNGMWKFEDFMELDMPRDWMTVQIITVIDASTFSTYLTNMRSIMMEQFKYSDTVLFNRCNSNTKKADLRRTVKLVNRKAQIIYENESGVSNDDIEDDDLPFDLESDPIEIEEDDFGLWYIDAMDNQKRYDGKRVHFKGMVYKDKRMPKNSFVPGRFAMTCCADDIAFIGFYCMLNKELSRKMDSIDNRTFVMVTATVEYEFRAEYKGRGPVLHAEEIVQTTPPAEEIVYFN